MKEFMFLALLTALLLPASGSAQVQVQGGASFTLDLPIVIPRLVVVQPGIQVVPDVDYEVFHADGWYWTRHEGRWYRSHNPRNGWAFAPRGVPPGLSRMTPGKYRRWRGAAPAPARGQVLGGPRRFGPAPGPALRGDERHGGKHGDRGRDHDDRGRGRADRGRGHGDRGEGKHGRHD